MVALTGGSEYSRTKCEERIGRIPTKRAARIVCVVHIDPFDVEVPVFLPRVAFRPETGQNNFASLDLPGSVKTFFTPTRGEINEQR